LLAEPVPLVDGPRGRGRPLAAERPVPLELGAGQSIFIPVQFQPGQRYRIWTANLTANADSTLTLYGPDGEEIGYDDDGGGGFASRLVVRQAADGPHVLEVGNIGAAGSFTLAYAPAGAAAPDLPFVADERGRGTAATLGRRYSVTLDRRQDRFVQLDLRAGVAVELRTEDLEGDVDTMLALFGPDGALLGEDDDSGDGLASLLRVTPAADGPHVVRLRNIGSAGAFDFVVEAR
uniref:hypothetical protein n=1 Tax=Falsiroseomonas oryzae TaxID=2766473 RepID=UPI0022EA467A